MVRTSFAIILLFFVSRLGYAQNICDDSTAIRVDTVHVDLILSPTSTVSWETIVMKTTTPPPGKPFLHINPWSIRFYGDGTVPDGMTTGQIFDLAARTSIARAIAIGDIPCAPSCGSPDTIKVYTPNCVERLGSGVNTHFGLCLSTGCCVRLYTVCCPNGVGSPVITLISALAPPCSGIGSSGKPCESTCY